MNNNNYNNTPGHSTPIHSAKDRVNFNTNLNKIKYTNSNTTSSNNSLMKIQSENDVLFQRILNATKERKKNICEEKPPLRLTSSAINRQREQQRIEKENHVFKCFYFYLKKFNIIVVSL
jgi:hypothetical protein